jgi:hypothetical protein
MKSSIKDGIGSRTAVRFDPQRPIALVTTRTATYPGAIGPMIEPLLTAASTLIAGLVGAGKVKIAAAIYDLGSGVVSYLD